MATTTRMSHTSNSRPLPPGRILARDLPVFGILASVRPLRKSEVEKIRTKKSLFAFVAELSHCYFSHCAA